MRSLCKWQDCSFASDTPACTFVIVFLSFFLFPSFSFFLLLSLSHVGSYYLLLNSRIDTTLLEFILESWTCLICKIQVRHCVKQEFQEISATQKRYVYLSPCSVMSLWRQSPHSTTLRSFTRIQSHSLRCLRKWEGEREWEREIIHQPLHLGLMACFKPTYVMYVSHMTTHSFVSEYQQAAVSRPTNGFSNPLVC